MPDLPSSPDPQPRAAHHRTPFASLLEPLGLVDMYHNAFLATGIRFEVPVTAVVGYRYGHVYVRFFSRTSPGFKTGIEMMF